MPPESESTEEVASEEGYEKNLGLVVAISQLESGRARPRSQNKMVGWEELLPALFRPATKGAHALRRQLASPDLSVKMLGPSRNILTGNPESHWDAHN